MKILSTFLLVCISVVGLSNEPSVDIKTQARLIFAENEPTYVHAIGITGSSFDPLEAKIGYNSEYMNMLYTTPVEIGANGRPFSFILETYSYNPIENKISLKIKNNASFEDGTPITTKDIAIAIKRALHNDSNSVVIDQIVGAKNWQTKKYPLMERLDGISEDEANGIVTVQFKGHVFMPIENLSDRIFSIIPARCIDNKTGHMTCDVPPFSGPYRLGDNIINSKGIKATSPTFRKFNARIGGVPPTIWFIVMRPEGIIEYMDSFNETTVIDVNEPSLQVGHRDALQKNLNVWQGPNLRFSALLLNARSASFKEQRVRQFFANEYRKTLKAYGFRAEGSLFPKLNSGFLPLGDLAVSFTAKESASILSFLRKNPPTWNLNIKSIHDPFHIIFRQTLERLHIDYRPSPDGDFKDLWENGQVSIRPFYVWVDPNTPVGDIKSMMTYGAAGILDTITQGKDFRSHLLMLNQFDQQSIVGFNRYVFTDAQFSVVDHHKKLFFTSKKTKITQKHGITRPKPWEFF